jgi:hypothetical protein
MTPLHSIIALNPREKTNRKNFLYEIRVILYATAFLTKPIPDYCNLRNDRTVVIHGHAN